MASWGLNLLTIISVAQLSTSYGDFVIQNPGDVTQFKKEYSDKHTGTILKINKIKTQNTQNVLRNYHEDKYLKPNSETRPILNYGNNYSKFHDEMINNAKDSLAFLRNIEEDNTDSINKEDLNKSYFVDSYPAVDKKIPFVERQAHSYPLPSLTLSHGGLITQNDKYYSIKRTPKPPNIQQTTRDIDINDSYTQSDEVYNYLREGNDTSLSLDENSDDQSSQVGDVNNSSSHETNNTNVTKNDTSTSYKLKPILSMSMNAPVSKNGTHFSLSTIEINTQPNVTHENNDTLDTKNITRTINSYNESSDVYSRFFVEPATTFYADNESIKDGYSIVPLHDANDIKYQLNNHHDKMPIEWTHRFGFTNFQDADTQNDFKVHNSTHIVWFIDNHEDSKPIFIPISKVYIQHIQSPYSKIEKQSTLRAHPKISLILLIDSNSNDATSKQSWWNFNQNNNFFPASGKDVKDFERIPITYNLFNSNNSMSPIQNKHKLDLKSTMESQLISNSIKDQGTSAYQLQPKFVSSELRMPFHPYNIKDEPAIPTTSFEYNSYHSKPFYTIGTSFENENSEDDNKLKKKDASKHPQNLDLLTSPKEIWRQEDSANPNLIYNGPEFPLKTSIPLQHPQNLDLLIPPSEIWNQEDSANPNLIYNGPEFPLNTSIPLQHPQNPDLLIPPSEIWNQEDSANPNLIYNGPEFPLNTSIPLQLTLNELHRIPQHSDSENVFSRPKLQVKWNEYFGTQDTQMPQVKPQLQTVPNQKYSNTLKSQLLPQLTPKHDQSSFELYSRTKPYPALMASQLLPKLQKNEEPQLLPYLQALVGPQLQQTSAKQTKQIESPLLYPTGGRVDLTPILHNNPLFQYPPITDKKQKLKFTPELKSYNFVDNSEYPPTSHNDPKLYHIHQLRNSQAKLDPKYLAMQQALLMPKRIGKTIPWTPELQTKKNTEYNYLQQIKSLLQPYHGKLKPNYLAIMQSQLTPDTNSEIFNPMISKHRPMLNVNWQTKAQHQWSSISQDNTDPRLIMQLQKGLPQILTNFKAKINSYGSSPIKLDKDRLDILYKNIDGLDHTLKEKLLTDADNRNRLLSLNQNVNKPALLEYSKYGVIPLDQNINSENINVDQSHLSPINPEVMIENINEWRDECGERMSWISNCHQCNCKEGKAVCTKIPGCVLRPIGQPMMCKPYSRFNIDECYACTCSGDGVPQCEAQNCNNHHVGHTLPLYNQFLDSNTTRHLIHYFMKYKRLPSLSDKDEPTCESGTSWVSSCYKCDCINGHHNCEVNPDCVLDESSYGKPGRCRPNTNFYPKSNMPCVTCTCDDEGQPHCPNY